MDKLLKEMLIEKDNELLSIKNIEIVEYKTWIDRDNNQILYVVKYNNISEKYQHQEILSQDEINNHLYLEIKRLRNNY